MRERSALLLRASNRETLTETLVNSRERPERSREFTKVSVRVSRLEALNSSALRSRILRRLREHLNLGAKRHHLGAVRGPPRGQNRKRLAARVCQTRSGAHAERIVDDQQQEFLVAHIRGRAIDERIRKREREQEQQEGPERKQKQVAQTAMLDRTLRA